MLSEDFSDRKALRPCLDRAKTVGPLVLRAVSQASAVSTMSAGLINLNLEWHVKSLGALWAGELVHLHLIQLSHELIHKLLFETLMPKA